MIELDRVNCHLSSPLASRATLAFAGLKKLPQYAEIILKDILFLRRSPSKFNPPNRWHWVLKVL